MTEYGLFNDEGLVEGGFFSASAAETGKAEYEDDDDLTILEVCESHTLYPKGLCEICDQQNDEEYPYLMDTKDD